MIFNDFNIYDITEENLENYYQKISIDNNYFKLNNINTLNHNGSSLLFYASSYNNIAFCNFLIEKGININVINNYGISPLTCANKDIFELIIKNKKLDKEKIFLSLINSIDSSAYHLDNFSLFLEHFEQEIIKSPQEKILQIHTAVFCLNSKNNIIEKIWTNFCKKHNITYSIIDIFKNHMLNCSNKYLYINHDNLEYLDMSYKEKHHKITNLYHQFIIDLSNIMEIRSKKLTEEFLLSSLIKKDIANLSKNKLFEVSISNDNIEYNFYQKEITYIKEMINVILKDKVNENGFLSNFLEPPYLLTIKKDYSFLFSHKNININPIKNLIKQYDIESISLSKEHNINTLFSILNTAFNTVSNIFNLSSFNLDFQKLHIDTFPYNTNNPNIIGAFDFKNNKLWINSKEIDLSNHIQDIEPETLSNFMSVFIHEYTHFLQYINEKNPHYVFENDLQSEWKEILNIINYKKYTLNDVVNIGLSFANDSMSSENLTLNTENSKQIKLHLTNYFSGQQLSLKKIKSFIVNDKNKENLNWNHFEKLIILLNTCYKNPTSFQQEIWNNYDKIMNGNYHPEKKVYYNDNIEIHARLNETVFFNNQEKNIIDIGYFLNEQENENLINLLKPKLIKFNQLLLANKTQFNFDTKHVQKTKNKLR